MNRRRAWLLLRSSQTPLTAECQIEPMLDKSALSGADRSADEDSRGMPRQVLPMLVS